jgi:type II secretory pathway pseudopilin PulG
MAITSLVLGIVGCFLTAPVGLILGIVSLVKANRRPNEYGGKGFAIAGIALNAVGLLILPIIAAIAIPNLMAARRSANEASAIATIRTISSAEQVYTATVGKRCGDLKTLAAANLVDPTIAAGERSGYRFMVVALPTAGGDCAIHATPLSPSHGTRSFYFSSEDGEIRAAAKNGAHASEIDAPIGGYDSPPNKQTRNISTY